MVKKAFVLCFALAAGTASLAEAQSPRTWVSGAGSDANLCTRAAPCRSFAAAIAKTTAGGTIAALDGGDYADVTITKSITVDGGGEHARMNGVIVTAGADDIVILRNLAFEGVGSGVNGVQILSAAQVHIENVTVQNYISNGIISSAAGNVFITDTTVKGVPSQGIYIQSGRASLNRVTTHGNGVGVLVGSAGNVTITNSVASGNEIGFGAAYASASELSLEDCVTSQNRYGVLAIAGATVRLSNVSVFHDTIGLYNGGSGFLVSFGNNRFGGNDTDGYFTSGAVLR
jgi:hypothetical protein